MRPLRLAVCIALAVAAGCASNNKDKLADTKWESEPTRLPNGVELPAGARVLEFSPNEDKLGYVVKSPGKDETTFTGKWKLGGGDYVTLSFDQTLNDRKVHVQKVVVSDDRKVLTMTDSDGTAVTFRRVEPKAKPAD